jgi:hypothetical protein
VAVPWPGGAAMGVCAVYQHGRTQIGSAKLQKRVF